ncbi:MAG: hypothetical protein AAGI07_07385 [Bacteroidota bacterium]
MIQNHSNTNLLAFLVFVLILLSCKPKITNDTKTLNKVFAMNHFEIKIHQLRCMGGTREVFQFSKQEKYYLLTSKRTKKNHKINIAKIDSLNAYLSSKIGTVVYGNNSISTSSEYMRFGDIFNSIDFELNDTAPNTVDALLNYSRLN